MPRPGGTAQTRVAAKPRRQVFIRQGFESFAPGQRGMKAPAPRSVSLEARVARSHEQQRPLVRSLCAPAHISAPCPPHGQRCMLHRRSVLQVCGLPGIAGSQCQLGASASWEPVPANGHRRRQGAETSGKGRGGAGGTWSRDTVKVAPAPTTTTLDCWRWRVVAARALDSAASVRAPPPPPDTQITVRGAAEVPRDAELPAARAT